MALVMGCGGMKKILRICENPWAAVVAFAGLSSLIVMICAFVIARNFLCLHFAFDPVPITLIAMLGRVANGLMFLDVVILTGIILRPLLHALFGSSEKAGQCFIPAVCLVVCIGLLLPLSAPLFYAVGIEFEEAEQKVGEVGNTDDSTFKSLGFQQWGILLGKGYNENNEDSAKQPNN